MNKTDKYYISNSNGLMIHNTRDWCVPANCTELTAKPFRAKLKITGMITLNHGMVFFLTDESGQTYTMNDTMFADCVKKADVYIEGNWGFYKQGCAYSIGWEDS